MLIDCPDCKGPLSSQAEACPRCAYPLNHASQRGLTLRLWGLLLLVVAGGLLAYGLATRAPIAAYYAQRIGAVCGLVAPLLAFWGFARR